MRVRERWNTNMMVDLTEKNYRGAWQKQLTSDIWMKRENTLRVKKMVSLVNRGKSRYFSLWGV